jgi:hypothetical protein
MTLPDGMAYLFFCIESVRPGNDNRYGQYPGRCSGGRIGSVMRLARIGSYGSLTAVQNCTAPTTVLGRELL